MKIANLRYKGNKIPIPETPKMKTVGVYKIPIGLDENSCKIDTGDCENIEKRYDEGIKKVIGKFLSTSSLHGLSHIERCKTTRQKAKWLILLLSIATFYLVTTASILNKAFSEVNYSISFMVKDNFTSEEEHLPLFPGVTICSFSPFTRHKRYKAHLSRYIFLSLGPPFSGLTFKERGALLYENQSLATDKLTDPFAGSSIVHAEQEFANLKELRHPLNIRDLIIEESLRCEDFFTYCYLGDSAKDCCSIFKGHLTSNGMCFTFAPNESMQKRLHRKPLSVDLDVPLDNATEREGVVLTLHDPKSKPLVKSMEEGIAVWPGMVANVKFTLQVTDYKERYKASDVTLYRAECPEYCTFTPDLYTQMNCENGVMIKTIESFCNCTLIIDDRINQTAHERYCDPPTMFECVLPKQHEIMDEVYKCRPACKEFKYQMFVNYAKISRGTQPDRTKRAGKVSISMRQKDQTYEFLKYHRYTFSSTLSEIGGLMGLFLGASLITVIEITIFLLEYFWHFSTRVYSRLINRNKNTLAISHA